MGFTMVIWVLVLVRVLQGLSTASAAPATLSFLSAQTATSKSCAPGHGFYEAATVVGLALGGWLAGQLYGRFGALSFTIVAVAYVLALLPFLFVGDRAWVPRSGCRTATCCRACEPSHHALRPSLVAANAVLGAWFSVGPYLATACPTGRSLMRGYSRATSRLPIWSLASCSPSARSPGAS